MSSNVRNALMTALLGFLVHWICTDPTSAQSPNTSLTQERRGASGRDGAPEQQAPVPIVQVGAGTTSASTTGSSGPQKPISSGQITLPPLPSAQLCEAYNNTSAHKSCLSITLRQ